MHKPISLKTYFTGFTKSLSLLRRDFGILSHLKWRPQLNPPRTKGDEEYWSEFGLIISMIGVTTWLNGSCAIRANIGSNHFLFTSTWLSKNTKTYKFLIITMKINEIISERKPNICSFQNFLILYIQLKC